MKNLFTKHPHSIGESYWQHFTVAFLFGSQMVLAGCACLIHAVLPFLFEKTASKCLLKLTQEFLERMPRSGEAQDKLQDNINKKLK